MAAFRVWWFLHGRKAVRYATLALVVLGLSVLAFLKVPLRKCGGWFRPACVACPQVDAAWASVRSGNYEKASVLEKTALATSPLPQCWQDFEKQFNDDLSVKFRLEYLPGRRGVAQPAAAGPLRLSTQDPYWLVMNTSVKAYVYWFQIGADKELSVIFPNDGTSPLLKNPVSPGEQRIPGLTKNLSVSAQPGQERLYMIAADWEIPELQQIAREAANANESVRKDLAKRFLARAEIEKRWAAPLAGLAFGQVNIESLGSLGAPQTESAKKE